MAIAFTNLGASTTPDINSGTDATSYASASWTPPSSGLIIVYVHGARAAGIDTPTISGNGLTWTQIGSTLSIAGGQRNLSLFGADATGSSAGVTTVDFGANTQLGCCASFFQATGVDLTGGVAAAFVQAPTATGTGTTGTVNLAAAAHADNRPIVGFYHNANEVTTFRTNWTEADDLIGGGHVRGTETQWRDDAYETTASATWASSVAWGGIAAELKATVAGGTNTPKTVDGTLTTAGATIKATAKAVAGTLTSSGALASAVAYARAIGGTLTSAGSLTRDTAKTLAGTLATSGALVRAVAKSLTGALNSSGALAAARAFFAVLGGTLSTAGTLTRNVGKTLTGTLAPSGTIARAISKTLAGALSFLGSLLAALVGDEIELLDVEISDSAVTLVALANNAVYTATIDDSAAYTVTLSDTTRS